MPQPHKRAYSSFTRLAVTVPTYSGKRTAPTGHAPMTASRTPQLPRRSLPALAVSDAFRTVKD